MKRTGLILLLAGALATPFFLGSGFAQGMGGMMGNGYGMRGGYGNGYGMMNSRGARGGNYGMMGNGYGMMGNGYGMMNGNWSNQNIPEKYQLSEKQQQKIQDIQNSFYDKIQPLQNQLRNEQQQYSATLNSKNPDNKTLNAQRDAIQNLWNKIGEFRLNARKQINQVLSDDQLAYFGSGHHFLMGMNGYGNMMGGNGNAYNGCGGYSSNTNPQGNQSQTGPRGMMNQN